MAVYQDQSFLIQSQHPYFNQRHSPGAIASASGIYRCKRCGCEIVLAKGYALPSQNEHEHGFDLGPASWQLIVLAL